MVSLNCFFKNFKKGNTVKRYCHVSMRYRTCLTQDGSCLFSRFFLISFLTTEWKVVSNNSIKELLSNEQIFGTHLSEDSRPSFPLRTDKPVNNNKTVEIENEETTKSTCQYQPISALL
jgi:hypothetical protein